MPIVFNEPLSFLQRITEYMEHIYLINKACSHADPLERMQVSNSYRHLVSSEVFLLSQSHSFEDNFSLECISFSGVIIRMPLFLCLGKFLVSLWLYQIFVMLSHLMLCTVWAKGLVQESATTDAAQGPKPLQDCFNWIFFFVVLCVVKMRSWL